MKCYVIDGQGIDSLKISERETPRILDSYDLLIEVKAVSLNYRDLMIAKGQYGAPKGEVKPFIPLSDMSGVVKAVGPAVTEFKVGDKVLNHPFRHWPAGKLRSSWARTFIGVAGQEGVLAQEIVYSQDALVKVPGDLNFAEASTLTIAGLTAWASVITHGKARTGDWVLLHGTGGVSTFSAQLAKAIGAKVVMTTSSEEKSKIVKAKYGIDATVNYKDPDWHVKAKELTGGEGFDVVVDVVGGETLAKSIQVCNYEGRVAVVGALQGADTAPIKTRDMLLHQVHVRGMYMESAEELRAFARAVEALKLKPAVDKIFTFENAIEAYRHLEDQKHIGKVVISL